MLFSRRGRLLRYKGRTFRVRRKEEQELSGTAYAGGKVKLEFPGRSVRGWSLRHLGKTDGKDKK